MVDVKLQQQSNDPVFSDGYQQAGGHPAHGNCVTIAATRLVLGIPQPTRAVCCFRRRGLIHYLSKTLKSCLSTLPLRSLLDSVGFI